MSNFWTWATGAAALSVVAGSIGWLLGFSAVLRVIAAIVDVVSPVLKMVVEVMVDATKWLVSNIAWPAIKDIFDDWPTAVFLATAVAVVWFWVDHRMDKVVDQLGQCQTEVVKLKKAKTPQKAPEYQWLWPIW